MLFSIILVNRWILMISRVRADIHEISLTYCWWRWNLEASYAHQYTSNATLRMLLHILALLNKFDNVLKEEHLYSIHLYIHTNVGDIVHVTIYFYCDLTGLEIPRKCPSEWISECVSRAV